MKSIEWLLSSEPVDYPDAVGWMESRVAGIASEKESEAVWLLEHPPLYTAGTSADPKDLLQPQFPVFPTGRGGQYTYHGPGQRVAYTLLDLKRMHAPSPPDVRRYVRFLEQWLIRSLAAFGVEGFLREGRVGVWVMTNSGEAKIAALGIRLHRWVSYHGISLNVAPDLSHFNGIVPCGIREYGVTSLHALGIEVSMDEVDHILQRAFEAEMEADQASIPLQAPAETA